jgi:hypothetical protein
VRRAGRLGLVNIDERRRRGRKHLANLVRVVSRERRTWIDRAGQPRGRTRMRAILHPSGQGTLTHIGHLKKTIADAGHGLDEARFASIFELLSELPNVDAQILDIRSLRPPHGAQEFAM